MADTSHTPVETKLVTWRESWSRRKIMTIASSFALVAGTGLAAAALFVGKATAPEALGFLQWLVPTVLGILGASLGYDKAVETKARQ